MISFFLISLFKLFCNSLRRLIISIFSASSSSLYLRLFLSLCLSLCHHISTSIAAFISLFQLLYLSLISSHSLPHSKHQLDLPTVPLGIVSSASFWVINQGYGSLELKHRVSPTIPINLEISYPDGPDIGKFIFRTNSQQHYW